MCVYYSPKDTNRNVLRQLVPIDEYYDQIHLEINLELRMVIRWTRVYLREQHVQRHFQSWQHIAISDLDILDLRGVGFTFEGFSADELDFD